MYLDGVKEDDERITGAWKEDANGLLTFVSQPAGFPVHLNDNLKTGLFSATVGAFIIEFYKQLSSDSGSLTVNYLDQISKQIGNFPSGNYSYAPISPLPTPASVVWVNAMWMISLVLSLTSALIATLLQQWARRYVETPKVPSEPKDRARARWFLFRGTVIYKMRLLVEIAPTLIHISVCLFFAGLVIIFHTINKKVAIAVDVSVGVFGLAYIMLTILPCLDVKCSYRTPMSYILWYPCHIFLSFTARCLYWLVTLLHGRFFKYNPEDPLPGPRQLRFVNWYESCESTAKKHWEYVMDGFEKSIIKSARDLADGDHKIITWLFSQLALYDKNNLQKLAACMPRSSVVKLMPLFESGFQKPLLTLLQSCVTSIRLGSSDHEDVCKRSLLICLEAIHHIIKTPIPNPNDLSFVRSNFANIDLMRTLWGHDDTTIRVISRSICSLTAKQVLREQFPREQVLGRRVQVLEGQPLDVPKLRWLEVVTGETSNEIFGAEIVAQNRMNLKSFINGVLADHKDGLPTEDATSFKETLAILLDVQFDVDFDTNFQNRLSAEVQRMREDGSAISDDVVDKLHSMFPFIFETSAPSFIHLAPATSTRMVPTRGSTPVTITDSTSARRGAASSTVATTRDLHSQV